jgi:hypothetical protein
MGYHTPPEEMMIEETIMSKQQRRSAPTVPLMPAGFVTELEAARLLGLSAGQLRNYRYRWNHGTPGEHGPLFFEGTAAGGATRIAYRREDLTTWQAARGKVDWKPATPTTRTMKRK